MSTKLSTPATALEAEVMPHLVYDLEARVVDLECMLLEALTPTQFALVQELRDAVERLTVAEVAASDASRAVRRAMPRPIGRDRGQAALHWLRARRPKRVA